jgi:TonB family protein
MRRYGYAAVLVTAFLSGGRAGAQDGATLAARLQAADAGSALDSADMKPWHLKITVQLFDDKGNASDHGTIEEWWNGAGADRREYATTAYTATEIRQGRDLYRADGTNAPPYYLDLLRAQTVHPMPKPAEVQSASPELKKVNFGKVPLECVMLSQPMKQIMVPMGLFPTYCFDPGKEILRASFEFGQQTILRNTLEEFAGKVVPHDISVRSEKTEVAKSEIVVLETVPIPDSEFAPATNVVAQTGRIVRVSGGTMAGNLISKPDPVFPAAAKSRHASGAVILHAVIGTDGHIHSLALVSTPDPDLAIAAIAAVRKWTYRPYVLNGVLTDVDTTITVNFTFGP